MTYIRSALLALGTMYAIPALAHHESGHLRPTNGPNAVTVPEIDASSGALALGAVACLLLLVWERKRRTARL